METPSEGRFSSFLGRYLLVAATALLGSVMLGGCVTIPNDDVVSATQFRDVVVPDGLRLIDDAHQSHSVEAASFRMGHYIYSGAIRREDAAEYVRQRMPQHNWALVSDDAVDENTIRLRFVRGHYAAEYNFIRMDGRMQMVVDYRTDYNSR